ncbi:uncharacterized protein PAC_11984 [Phialocephala subalpina]|uniref:Peptidase A1 domain-containing protein n=1 Tax=Phialocephala subalpina TaxID=576137 RepID=A0A1L7XAT6_9HELO|nr:uncharacterized protein PAC_11984 [Phialocephala subalpina]
MNESTNEQDCQDEAFFEPIQGSGLEDCKPGTFSYSFASYKMYFSSSLPVAFTALAACSSMSAASRAPLSRRHLDCRDASAVKGISSSGGFWFGDFSVGNSSNLSMLIDTGSGDVIVNPKLYKPSASSKPLNAAFTNTYGTTSSDGTGNGTVVGTLYTEEMSYGGLTAVQTIGSATGTSDIPGDGIVGFSGSLFWQFPGNSTSFMQSLCTQGKVSECRFGLVLENESTGSLILGELDTEMYTGDLTVGPIYLTGWAAMMDLAINSTIVAKDLTVELDSGTATIVGRVTPSIGIQGVLQNSSEGQQLVGYFPCDKPPTVGFSFPSQSNVSTATKTISKNSTVFNIPASAWAAVDNGSNNCTAIMSGQDFATFPGLWVVGQPFMQGRYIDHNVADGTIGIAPLKTSTTRNATSTSSPLPTVTANGGMSKFAIGRWTLLGLTVAIASLLL